MAIFTVRVDFIDVVGEIWMPYGSPASLRINLSPYDVEEIRRRSGYRKISRAGIEKWLAFHSGDFSRVVDFHASIGDQDFPFATADGENMYLDTLPEDL